MLTHQQFLLTVRFITAPYYDTVVVLTTEKHIKQLHASQVLNTHLETLWTNYQAALLRSNTTALELYTKATQFYKEEIYSITIKLLELAAKQFGEKKPKKQASCYTSLFSCYQQVGNLSQAKHYGELALKIYRLQSDSAEKVAEIEQKLQGITKQEPDAQSARACSPP